MKHKTEIQRRMEKGGITGVSFATVNSQGKITPTPIGEIPVKEMKCEVKEDTVFQCASLSKPVFAYLVLKLIETNESKSTEEKWVGKFKTGFNLKTPLYTVFRSKGITLEGNKNPFLKLFHDHEQAKKLTAEMVLSHTTGLPISGKEPYQFQFEPGTHYAYSGVGIECLQKAIKELTGVDNLETLAQEHVFGENALNMPNSTFGPNPKAASSLKTTAKEYAKFIKAWVNDEKLNYAFNPVPPADTMKNDYFPKPKSVGRLVEKIDIKDSDRNLVAWGLGIGLVKNKHGQIIGAYHTGDMGDSTAEWRSGVGVVIDPKTRCCTQVSVYLTKSPNGHILAEECLPSILKSALDYFFPTYGFARNPEELDGTDFHGLNPKLLITDLKNKAYKTKVSTQRFEQSLESEEKKKEIDTNSTNSTQNSTQKMFRKMNIKPLSLKPESQLKTVNSQKEKTRSTKPVQKVEKTKGNTIEKEKTFNPSPLPTSYDPNNKR